MARTMPDLSATELQHELLHASTAMPLLGSRWQEATTIAGQQRFHTILDTLVAQRQLHPALRDRIANDQAAGSLQRLLRVCELAGHKTEQVLREAIGERELGTAISPAEVLHWRISNRNDNHLAPQGDSWAARTPHGDDPVSRYANAVAQAMDQGCLELGRQHTVDPPQWTIDRLGRPPHNSAGLAEWVRHAGTVAGYREQYGAGDDRHPIGACPPLALPDARAAWHAAWRALGQPQDLTTETTMTTLELVTTVRAYDRARRWAPDWVAPALQHHTQTARLHSQDAQLVAAQAHLESDPHQRAEQLQAAHRLNAQGAEHQKIAADLAAIDHARTTWHTTTHPQRQAATRAITELHRRHLDPYGNPLPNTPTTAPTEHDLADHANPAAAAFRGTTKQALARRRATPQDQEKVSRRFRDQRQAADERGYSR